MLIRMCDPKLFCYYRYILLHHSIVATLQHIQMMSFNYYSFLIHFQSPKTIMVKYWIIYEFFFLPFSVGMIGSSSSSSSLLFNCFRLLRLFRIQERAMYAIPALAVPMIEVAMKE